MCTSWKGLYVSLSCLSLLSLSLVSLSCLSLLSLSLVSLSCLSLLSLSFLSLSFLSLSSLLFPLSLFSSLLFSSLLSIFPTALFSYIVRRSFFFFCGESTDISVLLFFLCGWNREIYLPDSSFLFILRGRTGRSCFSRLFFFIVCLRLEGSRSEGRDGLDMRCYSAFSSSSRSFNAGSSLRISRQV
jgi:hypothetical protein